MDKTKDSPIPEKTSQVGDKEAFQQKESPPKTEQQSASEPTFVRGTIDPPTKK